MVLNSQHSWELHCHSYYSDGRLSLIDLFHLAMARGVENLALTDHDTAMGFRAALEQNLVPVGLTLHPATELSCVWNGRTVHLVGLGINACSREWLATESDYNTRRTKRLQRILTLLQKQGLGVDIETLYQQAEPALPARPHIAQYLTQSGQVASPGQAFKKWLGQGKVGDVKQQWPELAEAVAAINCAGGMAVVAHPHKYKLTWTKARELLDEFQQCGGLGVEVSCVGMHPDLRKFLIGQVKERGLWASGGSDFHSPSADWIKLGSFPGWPADVPLAKDWLASKAQSS
ncbi:MAG: PHP domain-containing protein [Reinekea sp.]|jgi:3',5'-nucleoside bisphosphate phosphatase